MNQDELASGGHQKTLSDLLNRWPSFSVDERHEQFWTLSRLDSEEFFINLNHHYQAELIGQMNDLQKRFWLRILATDDVADVIQEFESEEQQTLLDYLDQPTSREVSALLAYAEDNAGGLMSSRFARLRPEMDVDSAMRYLQIQGRRNVETIYYAYV